MTRDQHTAQIACRASCESTYEALSTLEGLRGWWTPEVIGDPAVGHELAFHFSGVDELIRMRVDAAASGRSLTWTCLEHSGAPEWGGSTLNFHLRADGNDRCTLALDHHGVPHELVHAGWEHFLTSLADYAATGTGNPYTTT